MTLSQSRYADSSHTQGAAEEVGTEEGAGPTTPEAPGPPKTTSQGFFFLPVVGPGRVDLL